MTFRALILAAAATLVCAGTALAASPSAWTRATPDGGSAATGWTTAAPAGQPLAQIARPTIQHPTVAKPTPPTPPHASHAHPQAFHSEAAAKSACAGAIVWHARDSHVVHGPHSHWWNNTKGGAFLCKKTALAAGLKLSRY